MPGLKKAHFAMPPRWLKPVGRINSDYSTITFAISDPDGSIACMLLKGCTALFGKEVVIQKWVDKPALTQCSHCHTLGHIKTSKACTLGKNSVKCHICGGAHQSDEHDKKCGRKHAVAGICDCNHFKCLNCHKTGHNCRDTRCPARDLFRLCVNRRQRKPRGVDITPPNPTIEDLSDADDDLYAPPPLPSNPTGRQIRTALHDKVIANLCKPSTWSLEDDNNAVASSSRITYDPEEFPEAWSLPDPMDTDLATASTMEYSPSCPQGGTANLNLA